MLKLIFLLLCCLQLCISRKFKNPILSEDTSSPGVVKYNGSYYAIGEFNPFNEQWMPIYVSSDLKNWDIKGYVFDSWNLPIWARDDRPITAPEIYVLDDNTFHVYFTADELETENFAIGVTVANNILGPYKTKKKPLLFNEDSNVGGTILRHNDKLYMMWSSMNYTLLYNILGQELSDDGLSLIGKKSELLLAPDPNPFPYFGLFGPTTFFWEDYYYIIYSQMDSCTFYSDDGLLVARSRDPLGPYEVHGKRIVLSYVDYRAPAQPSIVKDVDDESYVMIFHTFSNDNCDGPYLTAATLGFNNKSWPYFPDFP